VEVRSASHPSRFTPRERARGTQWIREWLDPTAGLDTVVKRKIPSPLPSSVEQSHSSKTTCHLASQEIPRLLWDTKIHYRIHKSPPLASVLSQMNAIHISQKFSQAFSLGVMRPWREADYPPSYSAEVKE